MKNPKQGRFLDENVAKAVVLKLAKQYPDKDQFLQPSIISEMLDLSPEAIKQWIYSRRLPAVKLSNGYWKVKVGDLENYLKTKYEIQRRILTLCQFDISLKIIEMGFLPVIGGIYSDAILKAVDSQPSLLIADSHHLDVWKLIKKIRGVKMLRNLPVILLSEQGLSDKNVERALSMRIQSVVSFAEIHVEVVRILRRV